MLNKVPESNNLKKPVVCLLRSLEYTDENRGILTGYQLDDVSYLLSTSEFVIFICLDKSSTPNPYINFSLDGISPVLIPVAKTNDWQDVIKGVLRPFKVKQDNS